MSSNKGYQNKIKRKTKKVAKKVAKKHPLLAIFLVVVFIGIAVGGYFVYNKYFKKPESNSNGVVAVGDISFHFMMLGNDKDGDSIYIKAGNNDILIDAGSDHTSNDTIKKYINQYCKDNKLEYVIATHSDEDHIACFGIKNGIFDSYICETIIDFPLTKKGSSDYRYSQYIESRTKEVENGANRYSAIDCYNETNGAKREYILGDSMSMEILYNYYYDHNTTNENDYSVCLLFKHGNKKFLFTGDLTKSGEEYLVEYNNIGEVDVYKAGHHGSNTSSNYCLLDVIRPNICIVSCSASNTGYKFPAKNFIERISAYTERVYITSQDNLNGDGFVPYNGNIVVISNTAGIEVQCSNNNTLLKDTQWFKENRTMPSSWIS